MKMKNIYTGLKGEAFLLTYFRNHGLSEEEIALMARWGYFMECYNLSGDSEGIKYAHRITEKMKHYRNLSAEYISEHLDEAPWYWPTAMRFYKALRIPQKEIPGIMECVYQGKSYLFGIGKEEVEITEDMRKNGEWSSYTYSD